MLNRRQLIAASAAAGSCLSFGLRAADTATDGLIRRPIPRSGEQLPVVGIGTNRWIVDAAPEEAAALRATLRTFSELGGKVIDTAPVYRTSEQALGQIISELGIRDAFFLATKVDREGAAEGIARMRDSLGKLGTTQIDLMQVHNLRDADTQLRTMFDWQEQGLLRYVGITTSRTSQYAEMERLMNEHPLDFIQLNYSLADQAAAERLLPLAQDRGMAVMVNLAFARGRLFDAVGASGLPDWAAAFECSSWAQFFLIFVIGHPAVTCVIPGMTKPAHVADNMGAARGTLPDMKQRERMANYFADV